MAVDLIIAPEAAHDIADAFAWYEEQRAGLGDEFLSCLEATIGAIRRTPEIHVVVHEDYRRGLVRRFPYSVFYVHGNGIVTVYAVFHTARDPEKWRRRLP